MKKVLIVDDDEKILNLCNRLLTNKNYSVETANSAIMALKKLNNSFDLLLTDFNMPGQSGLWLAEKIRNEMNLHMPIIMMSGTIHEIPKNKTETLGINNFINKPFEINDFLRVIESIFSEIKNINF